MENIGEIVDYNQLGKYEYICFFIKIIFHKQFKILFQDMNNNN